MTSARAKEVLYDSETMLRRVDSELDELRDDPTPVQDVGNLLSTLQQACVEIGQVLHTLRDSRQMVQGALLNQAHDSVEQRLLTVTGLLCGASFAAAHRQSP